MTYIFIIGHMAYYTGVIIDKYQNKKGTDYKAFIGLEILQFKNVKIVLRFNRSTC